MIQSPKISIIKPEELTIAPKAIYKRLGYDDNQPLVIEFIVEKLISETSSYVEIKGGYIELTDVKVIHKEGLIHLQEQVLNVGKIISAPIKNLESIIIFVMTIGPAFDKWSKHYFENEDGLEGFIVDSIGSELVERSMDLMENKIIDYKHKINKLCSNRYSPGYCGWNVKDQHILFSFFPPQFCGISLTDTSLMIPIKSVSGIIGVGEKIVKKEYGCSQCTIDYCYLAK